MSDAQGFGRTGEMTVVGEGFNDLYVPDRDHDALNSLNFAFDEFDTLGHALSSHDSAANDSALKALCSSGMGMSADARGGKFEYEE
ncbi:hypothetical protein [Bradyrhizobium sp. AT1]|uniref:hypothetical protein n=1 Tax=Bradyrhizobium sp. AT1 TaxID=574934 RepID=UPI0018DCE1A2|nr:hypothetical protein [Bradyrhizobium sp. AT1]